MSIYSYKAITQDGNIVKGKLAAENEYELEGKLKQSGLDLLQSSEVSNLKALNIFSGVSAKELAMLCIHLHYLELAGVPILDSIADLRDNSENPKIKEVMMDLYDSLKNGKLFSEALTRHPEIFDEVFIGLIRAGERSGNFADIFEHLEMHYKWVDAIKRRIKKATTYPVFLLFIMCAVTAIMMVYVIPKLTVFLLAQNIPLPLYTTALIATSDFLVAFWWIVLPMPLIIFLLIRLICIFSESFAFFIDNLKLHIPVIGNVIRKIEIARFCHFFSIMYQSGIGILECLEVSRTIVKNKVLKEAIHNIKMKVSDGKRLTDSIAESGQFPMLVVRMFNVGENSGNLEQSLTNINVFYEAEINTAIDAMVGSLQPMLTFVMGGLLMWITGAVFGPVYGSFSATR